MSNANKPRLRPLDQMTATERAEIERLAHQTRLNQEVRQRENPHIKNRVPFEDLLEDLYKDD